MPTTSLLTPKFLDFPTSLKRVQLYSFPTVPIFFAPRVEIGIILSIVDTHLFLKKVPDQTAIFSWKDWSEKTCFCDFLTFIITILPLIIMIWWLYFILLHSFFFAGILLEALGQKISEATCDVLNFLINELKTKKYLPTTLQVNSFSFFGRIEDTVNHR